MSTSTNGGIKRSWRCAAGALRLGGCLALAWPAAAPAQDVPLRPGFYQVPGASATDQLLYQNPAATSVVAAGSWDMWSGRVALVRGASNLWALAARALGAPAGRYEYKFIVNAAWEPGDNRVLYLADDGLFEKPPEIILNATVDDFDQINVHFRRGVTGAEQWRVRLEPVTPLREWRLSSPREEARRQGYLINGGLITFVFDPATYGIELPPGARVAVAGNFNGWDGAGGGGRWLLRDDNRDGLWELTCQLPGLRAPAGEKDLLFKFVVNGSRWLPPPAQALNAVSDGKGNTNLKIDPQATGGTTLKIMAAEPLDLGRNYTVVIEGLFPRPARCLTTPGAVFDRLHSAKELGALLDPTNRATTYRLFAPRATAVRLNLYAGPEFEVYTPAYRRIAPIESYPLWRDPEDGVWEISLRGLDTGRYYAFTVDGPVGDGESFNPLAPVGDPYARAAAQANQNTIVMDPGATNRWFGGWTDQDYVQARPQDTLIYEMHVRGMTMHPSSGVPENLRGKFEGLLATLGAGTGLDHLKQLGVTTIELLPTCEFSGGEDRYDWGYAPVYYFAPESSYGRDPQHGSQYYELKRLINELHRHGLGVILDVVFNHVGGPNIFALIDKKYYFRLNPDFSFSNFSGCGNDIRTEAPMMRRLIVDNILYWMKEFHVDGFRFDLAELIDMDTMLAIRDAARAINPRVLLISEPWSFRGENKHQLRGTGWSAWNNDFRYATKDFVMGRQFRNRDWLAKQILGSVETWTANPLQAVNEIERHDDMALADEFATRPNRDGRDLQANDVACNRLAATILFTSLGIPMIHEGQEFLRSKHGFSNTFDKGDEVNAVRWTDRERPLAAEALAYYTGLMRLRQSPKGAAFRVGQRPPPTYYQWLKPAHPAALGYIVNAPKIHDGAGFIVLLNSSAEPVNFQVPFPAGRWRLIGDGVQINPDGIAGAPDFDGPRTVELPVPGIRAYIFMNGFP